MRVEVGATFFTLSFFLRKRTNDNDIISSLIREKKKRDFHWLRKTSMKKDLCLWETEDDPLNRIKSKDLSPSLSPFHIPTLTLSIDDDGETMRWWEFESYIPLRNFIYLLILNGEQHILIFLYIFWNIFEGVSHTRMDKRKRERIVHVLPKATIFNCTWHSQKFTMMITMENPFFFFFFFFFRSKSWQENHIRIIQ